DEVFAELRRRLVGWQYSRERFTPIKAAMQPLVSMAVCAVVFVVAVVLAISFQDGPAGNNFVGVIRFFCPPRSALVPAWVTLAPAAWMVVRMRPPPDMLYLRPPEE